MTHPLEGESLLEELLKARDKLNLPPDDPMCDFIDERTLERFSGLGLPRDLKCNVASAVPGIEKALHGLPPDLSHNGDTEVLKRFPTQRMEFLGYFRSLHCWMRYLQGFRHETPEG